VIEIKRVHKILDVLPELDALFSEHWAEADESDPLRYRYDIFMRMWDQGMLRCWGIFDSGLMVGYGIAYVVVQLPTGNKAAEDMAMYVRPNYRKGYGAAMFRAACHDLKEEGVIDFGVTCKVGNRTDMLIRRLGFKHTSNHYVRRLNEVKDEQAISTASP
jgi:GNAT superfamily N-acetyltransferase